MAKLFKLALKQNSYNFPQLGSSAKNIKILDLCLQLTEEQKS